MASTGILFPHFQQSIFMPTSAPRCMAAGEGILI
jgi:hypothetical protein